MLSHFGMLLAPAYATGLGATVTAVPEWSPFANHVSVGMLVTELEGVPITSGTEYLDAVDALAQAYVAVSDVVACWPHARVSRVVLGLCASSTGGTKRGYCVPASVVTGMLDSPHGDTDTSTCCVQDGASGDSALTCFDATFSCVVLTLQWLSQRWCAHSTPACHDVTSTEVVRWRLRSACACLPSACCNSGNASADPWPTVTAWGNKLGVSSQRSLRPTKSWSAWQWRWPPAGTPLRHSTVRVARLTRR